LRVTALTTDAFFAAGAFICAMDAFEIRIATTNAIAEKILVACFMFFDFTK
jgi:hypothetical protein